MKTVYLIDAKRTPQVKSGTDIKDLPLPYLGVGLIRDIINKTDIPYTDIDEVIVGNTGAPAKFPNIGRIIGLEAGLHKKIGGYTVHRNCASGLEAVSQGFVKVSSGRADLILAGGIESMSQMPLIFSKELTEAFIELMKAKSVTQKLSVLKSIRLNHLAPVIAIEQGLTDPFCGINMGQTAELLAREYSITRQEQDEFALRSHQLAIAAQEAGKWKDEIVPLHIGKKLDQILDTDIGPRANSNLEKLAKMKPYFDKKSGSVTVANSCPLTDGGSMTLLASEEAVKKYNLKPMAKITDFHFHGLEPERMGMGPLLAMDGVLKRTGQSINDMELIEINEAFAAQVLSVIKVAKDKKLCEKYDMDNALGEIPLEKLNVNGGGIALGHPVGSTGSRLVVTLSHELRRQKKKFGIASLCIGGGQGGACIVENLEL